MIGRLALALALALAATLTACGKAPGDRFVEQLVERFDAPDCASATMVKAGRNPDKTEPGARTVFAVDDACLDALERSFDVIGFAQIEEDTFRYTSDRGWYELVQLTRADDRQQAGIVWETIEP